MRLRNISLAIKAVSQDITIHASTLPEGIERQNLAQDVGNLHEAINRIKVDREGGH